MAAPDPALWPAVRRVLDALDEVPADEVERAIRTHCTGSDGRVDEGLLAEVRAAWAAEEASEEEAFLSAAAAESAAHLLADALPDAVGRRVGPWEVTGLLGEGGMGVVYRARRADGAYDQQAALKVIGRGLAPPSLVERFRRERQILAGLSHPHVARLLDGGVSEAGQPYFAMELVEGAPITAFADRHGLAVEGRVRLLRQVVEAVAYAHRHLVVHRDLKPSNVLVTGDAGAPRAMLLDFGIAKLLDGEAGQTRTTLLTPGYAAPEQVAGGEVTTATDVYALGVLLYELLTGQRPHDLEGLSPAEVERTLATTPPPPSAVGGSRLGDLDAVVLKALCPEPGQRYASADAFGDDLDRVLAGLPVLARPPTLGYRVGSFVRRHPVGVAAATAFVALLVGFSAVTAVQARRLAAERDRAQTAAEEAGEMQEYLVGLFTAVDPNATQGDEITVRELLAQGADRIETDLAGRPAIQSELYRRVGSVYQRLGLFAESADAYGRALALSRRAHGSAHPDGIQLYALLGGVLFEQGDARTADSVLAVGRALVPGVFDDPHAFEADLYRVTAMVRNSEGDYQEADALYRRAIALHQAADEYDPTRLGTAITGLALALYNRGDYDGADSLFQRRLSLSRELHGESHTDVATAHHFLGLVARSDGRPDDAVRHYRRALALRSRILGDDHSDTAQTLQNLAVVVRNLGRYAEAEALYRQALAPLEARLGPRHYQVAIVHNNLAAAMVADRRPGDALPHAERAVRDVEAHFGRVHASTAVVRNTRAKAWLGVGRLREAEAEARDGLRDHRAAIGGVHPRQAALLSTLGRALHAQGRLPEAEAALRDALALLVDEHDSGDVRIAEARVDLGLVLAERGALDEARRLAAQAQPPLDATYADPSIEPHERARRLRAAV